MYCYQCGAELPDGAQFCNNCGAAQHTAPPSAPQTDSVPQSGGAANPILAMSSVMLYSAGHKTESRNIDQPYGGILMVTDEGVSYWGATVDEDDHFYPFDQIRETKYALARAVGLIPMTAYHVVLKDGADYAYRQPTKKRFQPVDEAIRSGMQSAGQMAGASPAQAARPGSDGRWPVMLVRAGKHYAKGAYSIPYLGLLTVTDSGISYRGVTIAADDHSYTFDQIKSTNYKMAGSGQLSFYVYLETGEIYAYCGLSKTKFEKLEDEIRRRARGW